MSTHRFCIVLQTFGFDDDEEYEMDDGGDDGIHFNFEYLGFIEIGQLSLFTDFFTFTFVNLHKICDYDFVLTPSATFVKQKDQCFRQMPI